MEALTPVALREESAVFIGQERTSPEKRLVHRRSALRKSRFIRPRCVVYFPFSNPHWPCHRISGTLLPIFGPRVLIFMSQPRVSLALVLDNPQHISSESDDDVPTMCSRASTSRQVFPTSPKDSEFIGSAITHLTNCTHRPFAFPAVFLHQKTTYRPLLTSVQPLQRLQTENRAVQPASRHFRLKQTLSPNRK